MSWHVILPLLVTSLHYQLYIIFLPSFCFWFLASPSSLIIFSYLPCLKFPSCATERAGNSSYQAKAGGVCIVFKQLWTVQAQKWWCQRLQKASLLSSVCQCVIGFQMSAAFGPVRAAEHLDLRRIFSSLLGCCTSSSSWFVSFSADVHITHDNFSQIRAK